MLGVIIFARLRVGKRTAPLPETGLGKGWGSLILGFGFFLLDSLVQLIIENATIVKSKACSGSRAPEVRGATLAALPVSKHRFIPKALRGDT
jgi:hypothetical protein